jgi:hypothetical protein
MSDFGLMRSLSLLCLNTLRSLGLESLPRCRSHGHTLAGPKALEEFGFKALRFKPFQVLTDEPPDIVARRAVVGREAPLFHKLFELLRQRDGHGAGKARHRVRKSMNYCYFFIPP